jgi:putative phage-type endonuclease
MLLVRRIHMPRAKKEAPVTELEPVVPAPVETVEEMPPEKPKRTRKAPVKKVEVPDSKSGVTDWIDPATMTQEVADTEAGHFSPKEVPAIELPTYASAQEAIEVAKAEGGWSEEAKALVKTDLTEPLQQLHDIVAEDVAMIEEAEQADAMAGSLDAEVVAIMADEVEWEPTDEEIEALLAGAEQTPEILELRAEAAAAEAEAHPILGPEYGNAEFVEYAEDGSERWHELRSRGIGGSDTASVLGIGFKSAYTLWMEKKGFWEPLPPDEGLQKIFYWGHKQETAIAEAFIDGHPEWEAHEGGSWRKKDAPWMLANPDRLLINMETGEVSILEIKTSETGTGWDNDKCPSKYVVQLRHYLWVFGLTYGYLVVKIGNSDYREFRVPADVNEPITKISGGTMKPSSFKIQYGDGLTIQVATKNFLDSVEPPAMDGNKDIYEQYRAKNMSLDRGVEVELPIEVGTALAESQVALKKAQEADQEARNHVMAHMGTAQYATYNGARVASRVPKGAAAPYLKIG